MIKTFFKVSILFFILSHFRQVHSASVLGFEHPSLNHHRQQQSSCFLPFMSEMESRLESRSGSGKTPRRSSSGLVDSTFGSQSTVENLIDDMSDVANRLNRMPIDDADALRATTLGLLGNFPSHSSHSTSSSTGSGSGGGSASSTIKTSLRFVWALWCFFLIAVSQII